METQSVISYAATQFKESDELDFTKWYSSETISYLVHSSIPRGKLVVVFSHDDTDGRSSFLKQLRGLQLLMQERELPIAFFIAFQPKLGASRHFIVGAMYRTKLLILDPLGSHYINQDLIEILNEAKANNWIDVAYISTQAIQNMEFEEGLVSCGPLSFEILHALIYIDPQDLIDRIEKTPSNSNDNIIANIDLSNLLIESSKFLKNLLNDSNDNIYYTTCLTEIRQKHYKYLLQIGGNQSYWNELEGGGIQADLTHKAAEVVIKTKHPISIGFEFEINDYPIYFVNGKDINETTKLHSKVIVKEYDTVYLESDSGHAEIISNPIYSNQKQVLDNVTKDFTNCIIAISKSNITPTKSGRGSTLTGQSPYNFFIIPKQRNRSLVDYENKRVAIKRVGEPRGKLQGTLGIPLEKLDELFDSKKTWPTLDSSLNKGIIEGSKRWESKNLRGFILLIEHYIYWLKETTSSTQGPKTALPLMCRTNFHSIFKLLDETDKKSFISYVNEVFNTQPQVKIFPNGYKVEDTTVPSQVSILVEEWLLSIYDPPAAVQTYRERILRVRNCKNKKWFIQELKLEGYQQHDLLSPPPFFPHHASGELFTYAMGLFSIEDKSNQDTNILLELRDLTGKDEQLNLQNALTVIQNFQSFAFHGQRFEMKDIKAHEIDMLAKKLEGTSLEDNPLTSQAISTTSHDDQGSALEAKIADIETTCLTKSYSSVVRGNSSTTEKQKNSKSSFDDEQHQHKKISDFFTNSANREKIDNLKKLVEKEKTNIIEQSLPHDSSKAL